MEESVKTHKRKSKNLVDPGDLVSEKSLQKSYKILGQVIYEIFPWTPLGLAKTHHACLLICSNINLTSLIGPEVEPD